MNSKYEMFSDMEWIEEVLKNNLFHDDNENSDKFYKTLMEIKTAQHDKTITDELYTKLDPFSVVSVERGYYLANIHYDLHYNNRDGDDSEKRIAHFLEKSDQMVLKEASWFRINFILELRRYMSEKYQVSDGCTDELFFKKYGNCIEKEIYTKYKKIILEK